MKKKFIASALLVLYAAAIVSVLTVRADTPIDIVLLVDVSGFMRTADPERVIPEEVASFVEQLPDGYRIAVLGYSGRVQYSIAFTELCDQARADIASQIRSFLYVGFLDMGGTLLSVAHMLADEPILTSPMILLISGGHFMVDPHSNSRDAHVAQRDIQQALDTLERQVPIHTVGVSDMDRSDRDMLNMIATHSGGLYFHAYDLASLPAIFNEVVQTHLTHGTNPHGGFALRDRNYAAEYGISQNSRSPEAGVQVGFFAGLEYQNRTLAIVLAVLAALTGVFALMATGRLVRVLLG